MPKQVGEMITFSRKHKNVNQSYIGSWFGYIIIQAPNETLVYIFGLHLLQILVESINLINQNIIWELNYKIYLQLTY